jgi:hypothetical protein
MKARFSLLSAALLALIAAPAAVFVSAKGEGTPVPCRIGEQAPPIGFWTWPQNSHVKTYIRSGDFSPQQIPYLLSALRNWNDVSDATTSGVKFEYVGETAQTLDCVNCVTIIRGQVFDGKRRHLTELHAYSAGHNQLITYGVIVVDPRLTDLKSLTEAIAHELGHNLGLLDCYQCKKKSTLMGKFKEINVANNMAQPSACDIAQVKQAYAELKVRVRPSPKFGLSEDEGEEPVDDDTPVIVPKP